MSESNLPCPPALNARPLNPLSSCLSSGLSSGLLKNKQEKNGFLDYDMACLLSQQRKLTVTERMRQLDKFHMHTPIEKECQLLNIPSDRLNLLTIKSVLYLCGGLVGTRFSTEDLHDLNEIVNSLSKMWLEIESVFKTLDVAVKKLVITDEEILNCNSSSVAGDVQPQCRFDTLAMSFLSKIMVLQEKVKQFQNTIDTTQNTDSGIVKFDADPESKLGKKMPDWLTALISRLNRDSDADNEHDNSTQRNNKSSFTVGKLAVFWSNFMIDDQQRRNLSKDESEALTTLLEASTDCQLSQNPAQRLSRKYWASRFFNFLSKMTELASTPKDEKALYNL